MALKNRKTIPSLKEALYNKTYEFEFVQVVHLMHCLFPKATPLGTGSDPQKEAVELKAHVFLSAPPSDVFKLSPSPSPNLSPRWTGELSSSKALVAYVESSPSVDLENPQEKETPRFSAPPQLSVNFLGIAGIQGPLPLPYTEMLLKQLRQKDTVFRDFLDIFNHRLLSLYYRIEQKFSPPLALAPPEKTAKGQALQSLTGWTVEGKNLSFTSRNLLFYAGFLWQKPHNPYALKVILQNYFDLPVDILSFQGAWMPIPKTQRTYLGTSQRGGQNILGDGAVLGRQIWCQHAGIVVRLQFKDFRYFQRFLPFGDSFSVLKELIAFYLGPLFSFKIALSLEHKPLSHLGNSNFYLGWTSWLGHSSLKKPQDHNHVLLCPQRWGRLKDSGNP